jgi:hypothetical protein
LAVGSIGDDPNVCPGFQKDFEALAEEPFVIGNEELDGHEY